MKGVMIVHDTHGHEICIVPAKIRKVLTAMGNLVIVWDNGDKETIDTTDARSLRDEVIAAIDAYYSK